MSTGYKIEDQSACYFVTLQIVNWIDIFTRKIYRDILIDSLQYCKEHKNLEIYAFVIMSNHIHLLAGSNTENFSATIRDFKSFTAKRIILSIQEEGESRREWMLKLFSFSAVRHNRNTKYQIWTHENHAEEIYSRKFIRQKVEYIHLNPVRAGIVEKEEDYLYSSARNYAGLPALLNVTTLYL